MPKKIDKQIINRVRNLKPCPVTSLLFTYCGLFILSSLDFPNFTVHSLTLKITKKETKSLGGKNCQ